MGFESTAVVLTERTFSSMGILLVRKRKSSIMAWLVFLKEWVELGVMGQPLLLEAAKIDEIGFSLKKADKMRKLF